MKLAPLGKQDMPVPLALKKLLGPSFILLGLGLGSGELILWPYLTSNYGLGIMWAAVLGITFQFFLNMEIARYTLVTGESVFVGLARKMARMAPAWFIFSTLLPWIWPGIVAASGVVLASFMGIEYTPLLPVGLLFLIGIILTLGPVLYKTQETLQKLVIMVGVPFLFGLTFYLARPTDWGALAQGLVGKGDSYWFFPVGLPMATFLGAFAYAGAGGNLNLAQSLYVKAKGYGMGKFSGQITSILTGKKERQTLEGTVFECNDKNLKRFRLWWKRINIEHLIVFWATGALTILVLGLLASTTVYKTAGNEAGISFVLNEASVIANRAGEMVGKIFLLSVAIMLFFTQFSVFGSTSRIMAENLVIFSPQKFRVEKTSVFFYSFLWLQIAAGVIIFGLGYTEPLGLVILSAVLNAFTMFVYSGLLLWLNLTSLDKQLRPGLLRVGVVGVAFMFYGFFSMFVIRQYA